MAVERKKKEEEVEEGAPGWVVTYGDCMSLLLTFFILILSFSSIQQTKFEDATASIKRSLGFMPKNTSLFKYPNSNPAYGEAESERIISEMQEFKVKISENNLSDNVKTMLTDKGARFIVYDPLLFESGSAELKREAYGPLMLIADMLRKFPDTDIRVEGYTDDIPISTYKFQSNWELSSARAISVVRFFIDKANLSPNKLGATGYGEHRPLAENNSSEGRSKNRRVEIFADINLTVVDEPPALKNR
ncbi:MAG: OmpA family protein [Fibrobacteres bacterium]|nr:OmpA family protein [Fibrobacterota bacterium]